MERSRATPSNSPPRKLTIMSKYQALLQEWQTLAPPPRIGRWPILVYGAGNTGRKVAEVLTTQGCKIAGFLDARAKPGSQLEGKPLATLEDWLAENAPTSYEVIIAIDNQTFLPQIPSLIAKIKQSGFQECTYDPYLIQIALFPQDREPFCFGQRKALYLKSCAELDRLDTLLADEKSRIALADAVRAWSTRSPMRFSEPDEYLARTLPTLPQCLRFIDCGAFDGDTITRFHQAGYTLETIAAFEPDPANFQSLVQNNHTAHSANIVRFPCAVGSKTEMLSFSATSDTSSHIIKTGGGTFPYNASRSTRYCQTLRPISSKWTSRARSLMDCSVRKT